MTLVDPVEPKLPLDVALIRGPSEENTWLAVQAETPTVITTRSELASRGPIIPLADVSEAHKVRSKEVERKKASENA